MNLDDGIHYVEANGLRFAYLERGEGPLVLLLHGFPDTAHTWDAALPALADAGYRAVAPFLRGYPPTEFSPQRAYAISDLSADALALATALGEEKFILIGHDWGAMAAYYAADVQPGRLRKMVTVAVPDPSAVTFNLTMLWHLRHFIGFQCRCLSVKRLKRNHFQLVNKLYHRWSPDWQFTEQDLAPVKRAFSVPGAVQAALGYYWCYPKSLRQTNQVYDNKTSVPTFSFFGTDDGALAMKVEDLPRTRDSFTAEYDYVVVEDVGHFLHREVPQEFIQRMLAFLGPPKQ